MLGMARAQSVAGVAREGNSFDSSMAIVGQYQKTSNTAASNYVAPANGSTDDKNGTPTGSHSNSTAGTQPYEPYPTND